MVEARYYESNIREAEFSHFVLRNIPTQLTENISSEIHETNRISDPYIFLINRARGKLQTPNGQDIEAFMETETYLGGLEGVAFQQIQAWSMNERSGDSVWFSPPYGESRPVSKIVVSKIMELDSEHSILFNRAILLDIDALKLLRVANELSPSIKLLEPELLRSIPLFPSQEEFDEWFASMSGVNDQFNQISDGSDLLDKIRTYQRVRQISDNVDSEDYHLIYKQAEQENLVGQYLGSCPLIPTGKSTPFSIFSEEQNTIGETKTLECKCPFCDQRVKAVIAGGKIKCPECKKSVDYSC
jgi:hypothetical protein